MSPPAWAGRRGLAAPCPLSHEHDTSSFDCGRPELDDWLKRTALRSQGETARTYVVCAGARVAGFYTLAAGSVIRGDLPSARLRRNTPPDVPVIVLGRLAVDAGFQGMGIGSGMLKEAIVRAVEASREIGVKALVVHALDDAAAAFYLGYGFVPSPVHARTLVLPIATARAALG